MEHFLIENWERVAWDLGDLTFIQNQFQCGAAGVLDILAADPDGNYVAIELKREEETHKQVISQLSGYIGWLRRYRALSEKKKVRGIVLAKQGTPKLDLAAEGHDSIDVKVYEVLLGGFRIRDYRPEFDTERQLFEMIFKKITEDNIFQVTEFSEKGLWVSFIPKEGYSFEGYGKFDANNLSQNFHIKHNSGGWVA